MRHRHFALVALLTACTGEDTGAPPVALGTGPDLDHTPPEGVLEEGSSVTLSVTATDEDGVAEVTVFHKTAGSTYWDSTLMTYGEEDTWTAEIGPLYSPGLEYYFEAADAAASTAFSSLPEDGQADPLEAPVEAGALSVPFLEDFELEGGEVSLFTLGWWTPSEAFDFYTWDVSGARANSGATSALHLRVPDDAGVVRDWLISPALDLSGQTEVMLRWSESGANTLAMGTHAIYLSTGSRDIAAGEYIPLIESLDAPPEGDWQTMTVDISAFAGSPSVYLAFVYEGNGDDWYIDDVFVGALQMDLGASLSWSPDPVGPGETADVTVVFDNQTSAAGANVTATLSLPEGGGTIAEPTQDVGTIEGLGSASATWQLALDPDLDDNRYLPLQVEVTDGAETWNFALNLTVGLPSQAAVGLTVPTPGPVNLIIGAGDPAAPTTAFTAWSGTLDAGSHVLTADITDAYPVLPPAAGADRWFARVTGGEGGTFDSFTITTDGVAYAATRTPRLDEITTVWLPDPPQPVLVSSLPSTASPGDADLPVVLNLRNDGSATLDAVTGELVALSPDITVQAGAGLAVTSSPWASGEQLVLTGPTVTVGAGHDRSRPAELELQLSDGVESWAVPVSFDVPWPVLNIVATEIDDSGGDGILDSGETATITLEVANTGDLSTFNRLNGTLSVLGTSTATANITSAEATFFTIGPGSARDEDFDLEVLTGADGDTLDLELTLDDGTATYVAQTQITLGAPPWQAVNPYDDTVGDNQTAYDFDIVNAWFRVEGTQMDLLLVSDVEYDPATVFVEAWGSSSGAAWQYFRWVVQPGAAGMYGYEDGNFLPIGDVTVTAVSSTELMLSFDTDDMDLILDRFSIGLAAGWCGPDYGYFCDHFPNGWGWPYDGTSFNPGGWFELTW